MAVSFLPQAQIQYPGNADVSQNINALGNSIAQSLKEGRNRNALIKVSNALQGGDTKGARAAALESGDPAIMMNVNSLLNQQEDRTFRREESQRSQGNSDRSYKLQEQQANAPTIKTVKDASGAENLVRIGKDGTSTPIDTGVSQTPDNPYAMGKMNESQSKDALYARRMLSSERVLRSVDADGAPAVETQGTSWFERARAAASDKTGYNLRGKDFQKFDQAQRDFINATLRRESGAVIAPSEFDNANKQYFPMPGDTPDVITQKRLNRAEAIKGIAAGAGPSFRPDYVFDEKGELVANRRGSTRTAAPTVPMPGTQPAAAPAQAAPAQSAPVRVSSPQEHAALPAGAQYVAPDGSVRTKR